MRSRVGEFLEERGKRLGETVALGALFGRSRGSEGEAEIGGRRVRKLAERCIETSDAGRFSSRRRVVTDGLADSLPIKRLPAWDAPRTARKMSLEIRAVAYSVMLCDYCIYGALTGRTRKSSSLARGPSVTLIELARSREMLTRL